MTTLSCREITSAVELGEGQPRGWSDFPLLLCASAFPATSIQAQACTDDSSTDAPRAKSPSTIDEAQQASLPSQQVIGACESDLVPSLEEASDTDTESTNSDNDANSDFAACNNDDYEEDDVLSLLSTTQTQQHFQITNLESVGAVDSYGWADFPLPSEKEPSVLVKNEVWASSVSERCANGTEISSERSFSDSFPWQTTTQEPENKDEVVRHEITDCISMLSFSTACDGEEELIGADASLCLPTAHNPLRIRISATPIATESFGWDDFEPLLEDSSFVSASSHFSHPNSTICFHNNYPVPTFLTPTITNTSTFEIFRSGSSPVASATTSACDGKSRVASRQGSKANHVSFSNVYIQEYAPILGDHPYTQGYPLSLDWKHTSEEKYCIEDFESKRFPRCSSFSVPRRLSDFERRSRLINVGGLSMLELYQQEQERRTIAEREGAVVDQSSMSPTADADPSTPPPADSIFIQEIIHRSGSLLDLRKGFEDDLDDE